MGRWSLTPSPNPLLGLATGKVGAKGPAFSRTLCGLGGGVSSRVGGRGRLVFCVDAIGDNKNQNSIK